jgi:hypothetical protein
MAIYPQLRTRFTTASYSDTIWWLANNSALAQIDTKTCLLVAWLFDMPTADIKKDFQGVWTGQRRSEQNQRDDGKPFVRKGKKRGG